MTKAVSAMIIYGFHVLLLNRIEMRMETDSLTIQRIPERLGFKKEGQIR